MAIKSRHNILNYNRRIHSCFGVLSLLQSEAKFNWVKGKVVEEGVKHMFSAIVINSDQGSSLRLAILLLCIGHKFNGHSSCCKYKSLVWQEVQ